MRTSRRSPHGRARLTGNVARPIEVDPAKWAAYKVGSSVLWRLGKWLLGVYLPWRFRAGKPFHAGLPWQIMDLGLKVMSALLATSVPLPKAVPVPPPAGASLPSLVEAAPASSPSPTPAAAGSAEPALATSAPRVPDPSSPEEAEARALAGTRN